MPKDVNSDEADHPFPLPPPSLATYQRPQLGSRFTRPEAISLSPRAAALGISGALSRMRWRLARVTMVHTYAFALVRGQRPCRASVRALPAAAEGLEGVVLVIRAGNIDLEYACGRIRREIV